MKERGWHILATNWHTPEGEVDIIARDGATLVFVEVKSRRTYIRPEEAVDEVKQQRLVRAARQWLEAHSHDGDIRFDVVAVVGTPHHWRLVHFRDVFFPIWTDDELDS